MRAPPKNHHPSSDPQRPIAGLRPRSRSPAISVENKGGDVGGLETSIRCLYGLLEMCTNFETQRLTILTCETCQHAHCRYVKVRRSVEVWKCGSVNVRMCECVNV